MRHLGQIHVSLMTVTGIYFRHQLLMSPVSPAHDMVKDLVLILSFNSRTWF